MTMELSRLRALIIASPRDKAPLPCYRHMADRLVHYNNRRLGNSIGLLGVGEGLVLVVSSLVGSCLGVGVNGSGQRDNDKPNSRQTSTQAR
jgi:hypothetical protein